MPRNLNARTALYRWQPDSGRLTRLAFLREENLPGLDVKSSVFVLEDPWLLIVYRESNRIEPPGAEWATAAWHLGEDRARLCGRPGRAAR